MNYNDLNKIEEILILALENRAGEEQLCYLNQCLRSDGALRQHCMDFLTLSAALKKPERILNAFIGSEEQESAVWSDLLCHLAHEEKTAPEVCVLTSDTEKRPVPQPSREPVVASKTNKRSLFAALAGLAALCLLLAYLQLTPQSTVVATVTDCLAVQLADHEVLTTGSRLTNRRDSYLLQRGILEIELEYGTTVLIEAPADFRLDSGDKITLNSGKLYAKVPAWATGFIVDTATSRVMDLGTEFGVKSSVSGDTEVHVFKGKTVLVGGSKNGQKSILNLAAGQAGVVCDHGSTIRQIRYTANAFVQGIDSESGFIWKGQRVIPLNNLLAGHLFDVDPDGIEIDPVTGRHVTHENYVSGTERQGGEAYHAVDGPFVDGSFVPVGQKPQVISSTGLSYQFPATCGRLHFNLSDRKTVYDALTATRYPLILRSSPSEEPTLLLHPNMGITLDLDRIRDRLPALAIERFSADCGIAPSAREALKNAYPDGPVPDAANSSVDFTVLLDGRACKTLTGINIDSGITHVEVEIRPTDRFLTLVSTDGNQSFQYDWLVLADPHLEISAAE